MQKRRYKSLLCYLRSARREVGVRRGKEDGRGFCFAFIVGGRCRTVGDGGRRSGGFPQGRSGEPKRKGWGGVLARQIVVEAWRCGSRWL